MLYPLTTPLFRNLLLKRRMKRRDEVINSATMCDDDDDDDEIAYFTVRWKTRELVLSTAPKTWDNTDKDSKNSLTENGPISRGSQSEMSMVRDLWGKWFTKEVSFEFGVKEWRGDGWGKWRTEGWIEVSIKRWNWFAEDDVEARTYMPLYMWGDD